MTEPAGEILVPDVSSQQDRLAQTDQKVKPPVATPTADRHSLIVDGLPAARTVSPHGMSGAELERQAGAIHFMGLHCAPRRGGLWWLTTDRDTAPTTIANVEKRINRLQHDYH